MSLSPGMKAICTAFAIALATLLWLSSISAPPLLQVSELGRAEDGMTVQVLGVVVDIRVYDSGYMSMQLADHVSGDTIPVLCQPHSSDATLSELSVGDEVLVVGVVSLEPSQAMVFADAGGTRILSKAVFTMSVEMLCSNWRLFEFDRLNVSGVIALGADPGTIWLTDPLSGDRLRLVAEDTSPRVTEGDRVAVDCTLLMDAQTMSLYLRAWGIEPHTT